MTKVEARATVCETPVATRVPFDDLQHHWEGVYLRDDGFDEANGRHELFVVVPSRDELDRKGSVSVVLYVICASGISTAIKGRLVARTVLA